MIDLKSQMLSELQQEMEQLGEPKFRAKQISSWMHEKLADSFDEMTNLPKSLREKLQQRYEWVRLELVQVQQSDQVNLQISVPAAGRECDRKRTDEVSSWEFGLHILSGGLPDGLPVLCIDSERAGTESEGFGDAGADLSDTEVVEGAGAQCRGYGNRGAAG